MATGSSGHSLQFKRAICFIDGENLTVRYKDTSPSRRVRAEVQLVSGEMVWSPRVPYVFQGFDLLRVSYYTCLTGSDEALTKYRDELAKLKWKTAAPSHGQVVPHVFKKAKAGLRSKSVDINLTVDVLRHSYSNDVDVVILMSGDGDYLPLIHEVMRKGKRVYVAAFESGLNPELPRVVDDFHLLDPFFFE